MPLPSMRISSPRMGLLKLTSVTRNLNLEIVIFNRNLNKIAACGITEKDYGEHLLEDQRFKKWVWQCRAVTCKSRHETSHTSNLAAHSRQVAYASTTTQKIQRGNYKPAHKNFAFAPPSPSRDTQTHIEHYSISRTLRSWQEYPRQAVSRTLVS